MMNLQEVQSTGDQPRRLGSMGPVLNGFTYEFRRRENPPPLPHDVRVIWTYNNGETCEMTVPIRGVLEGAAGQAGEAIVFDLKPRRQVRVYLDRLRG